MDIKRFKNRLRRCRRQMTAVLASRLDPETIIVLKGNKPLELCINQRHRAVLYASDPAFLDAVLAEERGWREFAPAMSLIVFRHEVLMEFSRMSLEFIAQEENRRSGHLGLCVQGASHLRRPPPSTCLPGMDRLEGFHPGGPILYRRVLVPVCVRRRIVPVWIYVSEAVAM